MLSLKNIYNPQDVELAISGPNGVNRAFIYTGTAGFDFKTDSSVANDTITFKVGNRTFKEGEFFRAIATASPSSFKGSGAAVDSVDADWDDESGEVRLTAALAVMEGSLWRMAYQVIVLAKV